MRSFASFVARSLLASTVVLLLPGSATARGALCFDLPEASARAAERAASLPASSASSPRTRCVPRPLWDLQADAARSRVASSDVGLACEPAHVAFLCAAALAPPSDPFACRLEGDERFAPAADEGNIPASAFAHATTTPPGPAPPAELPDDATMRRCVWPVCEALCVARAGTSPRLAAERAESNENVCSRCAAACDAEAAGLTAEKKTAAPRNEPPEYCAALRAQRRGRDEKRERSERANAATDASPLGGPAPERGMNKNVASRMRRSNAWGCPGCDAAILSPYYHAAATAAAPISVASAVSSAASALGASSAATGAPSRGGPFRPPGAVESLAGAAAAASSASAASLVASFLVVAARVAVLDAIFRAVVNSLFVVVPPGQPVPGYVYHADAAGPGGIVAEKPEARAPPGEENAETTTPATADDPWAPWAGVSLPAPPPPNPNPNPNPPNPSPNPSPPNGIISPAEYSSSPAPPPLGIAPPTDRCGAGGSSSAAWSCVGECAMCIFDPAASEPNCCCDEECAALGDCCADFAACCALGLGDETKTRGGRETKVLGSNLVGGFEAAFGGPRVRGGVSRRGEGGGVGGGDAADRSRRRAAARGDAGAGEEARAEARGSRGGGGGSAEVVPRFAAGSRGFVSRVVVGGREATGAGRGGGGDGEAKPKPP